MANTLPPVPRSKKKDWVVAAKIAVWLVSLAPIAILVDRIFLSGQYTGGDFVDDPVELIQHWTGTASLIFLLTTLAITPVRRLASFNKANRWGYSHFCMHHCMCSVTSFSTSVCSWDRLPKM